MFVCGGPFEATVQKVRAGRRQTKSGERVLRRIVKTKGGTQGKKLVDAT
jgi:hypothetical protein